MVQHTDRTVWSWAGTERIQYNFRTVLTAREYSGAKSCPPVLTEHLSVMWNEFSPKQCFKRCTDHEGTIGFQIQSDPSDTHSDLFLPQAEDRVDAKQPEKSSRRRQDICVRSSSEIRIRNRWHSGRSSSKKLVPECCSQHNGYSQSKARSYTDKSYGSL